MRLEASSPLRTRTCTRTGKGAALCLATVCGVQFLGILNASMVSMALPPLGHEFGLGPIGLQWVLNAYTIAYAGFILLGGAAADVIGRRRTVLAGLAVHGIGAIGCALAPSLALLLTARAVQGLGSAIMLPASLALLVVTFPQRRQRDRAFGAWAASGGAALICGGLLGGVLSAWFGWRGVFATSTLLVAGVAVVALLAPDDGHSAPGKHRTDLPGAVLAAACLTLLVLAAEQIQASGWATAQTLLPLAGTVLSGVAFVAVERRSATPMIRLGLLRTHAVGGANVLNVLFPVGFLGVLFLGSLLLQSVYRFSGTAAGSSILPFSAMVLIGTALAPSLIGRAGLVNVAVTGFSLLAAGMLGMAAATDMSYLTVALPSLAVLGAGAALASVPIAIAAVAGVPQAESGMATGLLSTSQQAGGALMVAMLAQITQTAEPGGSAGAAGRAALAQGLRAGFAAAAVVCAIAAVLAPRLMRHAPIGG